VADRVDREAFLNAVGGTDAWSGEELFCLRSGHPGVRAVAAPAKDPLPEAVADNTVVVTEDDQGMRTLRFGNETVRQSVVKVGDPDHLELPYAKANGVGACVVSEPNRVCSRVGRGTIPAFLHKHYPLTRIDVVDIDPVVVEVAKQFFGFAEDATLKAYVQDGRPIRRGAAECL